MAGTYHKQYLPNYGVFDENRYFQSGTESPVFAIGETVIAANICEDIWYPTGPTTLQALGGAELVVSINASPYHAGKGRFREKMLATRAADDLVCLAFVNTVGGQDELIFDGQSFMFNEKGECVARGKAFEEDFVVADLDLDEVFRARLHDSRRRKEKLRATDGAAAPRIGCRRCPRPSGPGCPRTRCAVLEPVEEIYQALVLGTRDYVTKNGFRHVVLGPLGRHRLVAGGRHRVRRAGRRPTSPGSPCLAVLLDGHPARTRRAWPGTSASSSCACPSRRCSAPTGARWPGRSRG